MPRVPQTEREVAEMRPLLLRGRQPAAEAEIVIPKKAVAVVEAAEDLMAVAEDEKQGEIQEAGAAAAREPVREEGLQVERSERHSCDKSVNRV